MDDKYFLNNLSKTHLLIFLENEVKTKNYKIKILDIGCGDCSYWIDFLKKNPSVEFHGIDIKSDKIEVAKKNLPFYKKNIKLMNGRDSDFSDIEFDYIVSNSALEHIYKIDFFFDILHNLAGEKTKIILNWDFGHFRGDLYENIMNKLSEIFAFFRIEKYYTKEFSVKDFKKLISKKNFKILDEYYFNLRDMKEISKFSPSFNREWYEFELKLNNLKNKKILNKYLLSAYFTISKKN